MEKILLHNLKVLKKILAQPQGKKRILTKTKLPNLPVKNIMVHPSVVVALR